MHANIQQLVNFVRKIFRCPRACCLCNPSIYLNRMRILYPSDFLLLPFFVWILYAFFNRINKKWYADLPIQSYFMPALMFRLVGAFLTALMYQYYYKYGDTFYYYRGALDVFEMFWRDPVTALEMCLLDYKELRDSSPEAMRGITYHRLFSEPSTGLVMRIGGFMSWFVLGSYMGISLLMTTFAFVGSWLFYRVFYDMYPHLHRKLAYAILFLPSVCFWGTGLMKDSLTMGGLGFLVYGSYYLFIKRKRLLLAASCVALGGYLMAFIKVYIILALAPAMTVWIFLMYRNQIPNKILRTLATPVFLGVGVLGGVFALQKIGQSFQNYSFQNIMVQAKQTQWWLQLNTERDGGTGYTLGDFDPTPTGLLKVFPRAVNVTLFRPYVWETRKPIVVPSALESLITLLLTIYVFRISGVIKTLKTIAKDPVVLFCLIFSLIFAFAVGFSTLNFGSLARYKIPAMPFYFTALILLWNHAELDKTKKIKGMNN